MSLRPSKRYLYQLLKKDLKKMASKKSKVLDAACNDCRNKVLFPECNYWGMDFSERALEDCSSVYGVKNTIKEDLTKLKVGRKKYDICVTTNTLEHIADSSHVKVVETLAAHIEKGGIYLLNKHKSESLDGILQVLGKQFEKVEVVHYRNQLSRSYERVISLNGNIEHQGGRVTLLIKMVLTNLLCLLETLTTRFSSLNEAVYIRCVNKL